MLILLLLVVVLIVLAGTGLLGIGGLTGSRRQWSPGLLAALSAPVVLLLGVVLLAVVAFGLRSGLSRGQPDPAPGSDANDATATTTADRPRPGDTQPLAPARLEPVTAGLPMVVIRAADDRRFSSYQPVSGLVPGSVVRVRAEGFGEFERGTVEQCVSELGRRTACAEAYPVQFDEDGRAEFQFGVWGDFAPGGCRVGQPSCLLRLTGTDSGRRGTAHTVLVDRVTPGRVTVAPAQVAPDGQEVDVSVADFPSNATATVVLCAPPGEYDASRCTSSGPTFVIDAAGGGSSKVVVAPGPLGSAGARCGPRHPCGVVVVVGPGFVAAAPTPVAFSLGPGVAYDRGRMVAGVLLALILGALAVGTALRTDWTEPSEAATPALDGSDLRTDRTLDELFGTDSEIDERDPLPA